MKTLAYLAPWVLALAAWAQAGPCATQASAQTAPAVAQASDEDYATQVAARFDGYLDRVVLGLQEAGREGPGGFDARSPQMTGPSGKPLPIVYTERLTDRLVNHPRGVPVLTRDDLASAMRGLPVNLRDGHLVVTVVNPGGASAMGVAIPLDELAARLPDAALPGGVLLFDTNGRPIAMSGQLSADQAKVFEQYLPQRPPNLIVTETPYSVAQSNRADILIVARLAATAAAPPPQLEGTLFVDPTVIKPVADTPGDWLRKRGPVAMPLALGVTGGLLLLVWRVRRRAPTRGRDLPEMASLDYLDALAEPESAHGPVGGELRVDIEGEDALVAAKDLPEDFEEGVGEVKVLGEAESVPVPEPETVAETVAASETGAETRDEAEVDQILADLMESTAQDAEEASDKVPEDRADLRDRAIRLKERLAERMDLLRPAARTESPDFAAPGLPSPPRGIVHIGRSGATDEASETMRRHKTVHPADLLITKGEAQSLVEKEAERLVGRMQGLVRDVEIRTAEALAVHRETFRELLEQFEALQENRDRDLAAMHDLKNDLANEVTAATLKLKQAEAKATDGMLRLKEQMDNLTRKLEGWACDARISEERLAGALETIREGWENQMEAHAELRKEVMRLTESFQDLSRKQDASADREVSERRAATDQLAFEIKTVQLSAENDFSVMAARLDEIRAGLGNLGQRLDKAEGKQEQAIDAVYRKIEASEAVEALKGRMARDLEALKAQFHKEMENAVTSAMTTATQGSVAYQDQMDALKEENARVSARQHQMVQLMASLHTALGKADARASEEVERLKAQNHELQQMVLSMMRSGSRPPHAGAGPPGSGQPPPRRPALPSGTQAGPSRPDGDPTRPEPRHPDQSTTPPQRPVPRTPAGASPRVGQASVPAAPEDLGFEADDAPVEARPIDLWGRLLGRSDESGSQRKRRSK